MKKSTIALGAGLALIGGTGVVNAEEVAPVSRETTNVENISVTSLVTEKQVAEAEANVATQNEAVTTASSEVANISKEIVSNENAVSTASEEIQKLNTEKQELNNINSEEIAKNAEAKRQEEKQASAVVENAANKEAEKANQVQAAKQDADTKQAATEAKRQELKRTEQAIADKEAKNNAELNKLKDDVAKADEDIVNAKADVVTKENAYKNSRLYKAKEKALEDFVNSVNVAAEKFAAKKAEVEIQEKQDAVKDIFPYSLTFESTPEWNKAFAEYMKSKTAQSPYIEEIKKLDFEALGETEFSKRLKELYDQDGKWKGELESKLIKAAIAAEPTLDVDNTVIKSVPNDEEPNYDINNLPEDVLIELSQYFAGLINKAREELGLSEKVQVHLDDIRFAKEVSREVEADRFDNFDGHYGKAINNAARKRKLAVSAEPNVNTSIQFYENLASMKKNVENVDGKNKISKSELYKITRKLFQGFMHEGKVNNHYQHAISLMSAKNIGLDFSFVKDSASDDKGTLALHVIGIRKDLYRGDVERQKELYENSSELLKRNEYPAENEVSRKLQTLQKELSDLKADHQNKKELLNTVQEIVERNFANTPLAELENNFKAAQLSLKEKQNAKEAAVKNLDDYRKLLDSDDNLTVKRNDIAKELQGLQKKHEDSKAVYTKLTTELQSLQNAKAKAQDKLSKVQAELKELAKQQEQAKNKEVRLAEIAKEQGNLTKQVEDAKANIASLTEKGKEAKNKLAKAEAELEKAQNEYKELAERYRKEHLVMPETAERPEVTTKEEVITKPLPFKVVYIEDVNLPEGQEVVDAEGKDGVITLKRVSFFEGDTLLATDEVEMSRQEAVNKVLRVGVKKKEEIKPIIRKDTVPVRPQGRPQALAVRQAAGLAPMAASQTVVQTASTDKKILPNTGDKHSALAGLGVLSLVTAGFVAVGRRKEE